MSTPDPATSAVQAVFGLAKPAFAECRDDAAFFPSDQHLRALEFMGHTLWTRARVGVVTAEHGCGKSLLIRRLVQQLDERFVVAAVSREKLGPREFLLEVLHQFGFGLEDNDKTDRRRLLERFLHHQASAGRVCVLIVENAQAMHPSVLEELRYLAAVEADGVRTLKLLLLGQPSLNHVLDSPRMGGLMNANAVARFALGALSEDQTAAYVAHRLHAAGSKNPDELMPCTLMPLIHACTGGVPAAINKLCEEALVWAAEDGGAYVTDAALDRAIIALGLKDRAMRATAHGQLPVSLVLAEQQAQQPARLVIAMQGMAESEVPLGDQRVLIGRGEEADVRIDSVFVSRYHALIVRNGGHDLLLDLGSTNGLLINSNRIVRHMLRHQDLIQVGPARVTYLNPLAVQANQPDPGETICFARPGFPQAAGEEDATAILAFGRRSTDR